MNFFCLQGDGPINGGVVYKGVVFFRLVCMNLIQFSFLFRLLPVILPDPDLEIGGGGGRYQYCYEGINVNQQGDVETRNKTITVASFLFIFSIIIFCNVE